MTESIQDRITAAAVERDRERQQTEQRVEEILRVRAMHQRVGHVIDFGDGTYVAEILNRDGSVNCYGAVVDGGRIERFGETLHEALLIAIAGRNGVSRSDLGVIARAAARVLSNPDGAR